MERQISVSYESYLNNIDDNRKINFVRKMTEIAVVDKWWGWYVDIDIDIDVEEHLKKINKDTNTNKSRKVYPLYYSAIVPSNKLSDLDTIIQVLDEEKIRQMDRRYRSINSKMALILFIIGFGTCVIILTIVNV